MPRRPILIFAALILMIAAAIGTHALMSQRGGEPAGQGTPLVGGPFSLIDQDGRRVTETDFRGKFMLVFFGFTHCPDICPTELQVMTAARAMLGPGAERVTPVFISIDPERDTPEVLKAYVENFGPELQGLTGSPEEIAAVARAYRVHYAKAANPASPEDYLMDHTSIIYLMGPDGSFVKHFAYTTDVTALAAGLREALAAFP